MVLVAFEQAERKIADIHPVFSLVQIIQGLLQIRGNLGSANLHLVQTRYYFRLLVLSPLIMRIEVYEVDYAGTDFAIIVLGQFRQVFVIVPC
jgi:hypothetical protein